jgi:hypothetical protein
MISNPNCLLFVGSFLLGWAIWPNAAGVSDFLALCAVAFSVTGIVVTLVEAELG